MVTLFFWLTVATYRSPTHSYWIPMGQYKDVAGCYKAATNLALDIKNIRCVDNEGNVK